MFEYSIKPSEDHQYIILTVQGEFTAKTFMKCIVEAHTFGKEMGVRGYLVDVTDARNVDSALETQQFAYSDMKTTAGEDPFAKVAGLVSPGDHSHDFVETATSNAGMFLKLFTDRAEAVAYLLKKKP